MKCRSTSRGDHKLVVSEEEKLLSLLRKADRLSYALAHSYDIGGQPNRAFAFVALGEWLRETAVDVSNLTRPAMAIGATPVLGLQARALSLHRTLRGSSGDYPDVVPIVPLSISEQALADTER